MASQAPTASGGVGGVGDAGLGLSDVDITGDGYGDVDLEDPQGPPGELGKIRDERVVFLFF